MNRLGIYFFYDKDGIVDDYVTYYLQHLKPFCQELCVVVNKPLTVEGKEKLQKICDKLILRKNVGFDSCAYKEAMGSYGFDALKTYDELLLCNFTCFGPVYPFQEMFDKMAKSESDFWGITRYPRQENIIITPKQKTNFVPEHVMSYFLVIRNNILKDKCFKKYWDNLQVATNYAEAIAFNELIFTEYFESRGFKSDVFMSRESIDSFSENTAAFKPIALLNERCPLVKRRAFITDYSLYLHFECGIQPRKTLEFIENCTNYDTNLIWNNLLRTQSGSTLKRNLHLNYFLDENVYFGNKKKLKSDTKVALLIYSYYEDMTDYALSYAQNMPEWADIYIYVVTEKAKKDFECKFAKLPNNIVVEIKENRGQLASAVLISGKKIFENYDYICVAQTKKTSQLPDRFASEIFCNHCWKNILKSPEYVLNVIQSFYDNPRMGYACAIPPHWGAFTLLVGQELTVNKSKMEKILKEKFNIKREIDDEPIASYGECYWVRGKAYKTLFSYNWKHEDFPEASQTPKDGGILNALERLCPIFAQIDGFYPAWIMPNSLTSVYFDNIYYLMRKERLIAKRSKQKKGFIIFLKKHFYYLSYKLTFGKFRKKLKLKYKKYKNYNNN